MVAPDYHKKWREAHKEKLQQYFKEKVTCNICGSTFVRSHQNNHKTTKKHLRAKEEAGIKDIPTLSELNDKYIKISEKLNHLLEFN